MVFFREIKPLAAFPRAAISMVAGGGMLMATAFEPLSIASVKKKYGGGYNAAKGHCQLYIRFLNAYIFLFLLCT